MNRFISFCKKFWADEEGASASEYAILVAVVVGVVYIAVKSNFNLNSIFGSVTNKVNGCVTSNSTTGC